MKKMLWIGSYLNQNILKEVTKLGYRNAASVTSQKNILEGIEAVTGRRFDSINSIVMQAYPKQKLWMRPITDSHGSGSSDILVGYLNIQYLNRFFMKLSMRRAARKWLIENSCEELDVFLYEMRSACLETVKLIKKRIPNARVHLIIPDLPDFMDLHMSRVKAALKAIDRRIILKDCRYVDDYILYAAPMAEYLQLPPDKWMVMEGSIARDEIPAVFNLEASQQDSPKTIVMYSGSIQQGFCIQNLIDAFQFLDDSYELWITGNGDAEEMVKKRAEADHRIKNFGFLSTREALKQLQAEADIMVNIRDPEAPASRYCFPSKLFEYMLLGKPVLSCKLAGIPDAYFQYLIKMDGIAPAQIAEAIQRAAAISPKDRLALGAKARAFVAEQKNHIVQSERIVHWVWKNQGEEE